MPPQRSIPAFRLRHLAVALLLALPAASALATATSAPTKLQTIQTQPGHSVEALRLSGLMDNHLEAEGQVIVRDPSQELQAEWLRYEKPRDEVITRGRTVLIHPEDRIEGENLRLKLSDRVGELSAVRFTVQPKPGARVQLPANGSADKAWFEGRGRYRLEKTTYSTCQAPIGEQDWVLKTSELKLDYNSSIGNARNARIEYMGVPLLYSPWLQFQLDSERKSGFLAPAFGLSDTNGLDVSLPWYWNIAPNRDATLVPRHLSRRGLQLGAEYRYLERNHSGKVWADALPSDSVAKRNRWQLSLQHRQQINPELSGSINWNRVSDPTYFIDLSSQINQTSQGNLPQQLGLNWQRGRWNASLRTETWQLLEGGSPLYKRQPQINVSGSEPRLYGMRFDVAGEMVRFEHPLANTVSGNRIWTYPSLSLPWNRSYAYLTPKIGVHLTRYDLDNASTTGASRTLPIASLDAGLFLERDWSLFGRELLQTLEPRLYYVNIPHRNQSSIPLFDSGLQDISMAQLFSENQFSGVDRINDANQLTVGLTSRFLDTRSGIERLNLSFAQRFYFRDQTVSLNSGDVLRTAGNSDLLMQLSGPISDHLRLSGGIRYNTGDADIAQSNIGASYRLGAGKVINADYRHSNPRYGSNMRTLDASFQWPLMPKLYGVGRINYAFVEKRVAESLLGFEYNPGCWSLRSVMQRLATTNTASSNIFFIQLELRGLTQLGPNPLEVLQRNISGYRKSDEILP